MSVSAGEQRQLGQRVRRRQNEDCQPVRTLLGVQIPTKDNIRYIYFPLAVYSTGIEHKTINDIGELAAPTLVELRNRHTERWSTQLPGLRGSRGGKCMIRRGRITRIEPNSSVFT